jgi:hypothetical protein
MNAQVNIALLKAIATANAANTPVYVSQADGLPLVSHTPPLITVNPSQSDPNDATKIAATVTADGVKLIQGSGTEQKPDSKLNVVIATGFVRPKVRRGGGRGTGAPTKYPFETLGVGQGFFVADNEVSKGDAFKTLSSAVGSANQRYAKEIPGTEHQVTRAKRGPDHKTIKGADGKNEMETVHRS